MTNFYRIFALIFAISLLIVAVNVTQLAQPELPDTLHTLLTDLQAQNARVNFEFVAPLTANVRSIDINSDVFTVGEDYVCFSEAWNQGTRQRCTPFSNIASVTFAD